MCSIPLPKPLPLNLTALQDDSDLMEDVWIACSTDKMPLWLESNKVRQAIRALLKHDRCMEERKRLEIEAGNLCRWFGREIAAIELALQTPSCTSIIMHFQASDFPLLSSRFTPLYSSCATTRTNTISAVPLDHTLCL